MNLNNASAQSIVIYSCRLLFSRKVEFLKIYLSRYCVSVSWYFVSLYYVINISIKSQELRRSCQIIRKFWLMRSRFNHNTSAVSMDIKSYKETFASQAIQWKVCNMRNGYNTTKQRRARCPNRRARDYADNPRTSTHLWKSDSEFSCLNSDFLRVSEFSTK